LRGMFKTTNGGASWDAINTGLTSLAMLGAAIDRTTPSTLYATTGRPAGVFKSIDAGASWSPAATGLPAELFYAIAVDPVVSTTVYAAANGGVFKSINGGGNWTAIGLEHSAVRALAIDPQTTTTVYAGVYGGGVFSNAGAGTPVVTAGPITPSGGTGFVQLFTAEYSNSLGASDLRARLRFGDANIGGCLIDYNASTDLVRMQDDAGVWLPAVPFGNGAIANSQCRLDLALSSANEDGDDLTLALHLTFTGSFAGVKNVYSWARSLSTVTTTGWMLRGSWTVPVVAVDAISVTPNSGSGMTQTFVLEYSDSAGAAADLVAAQVRFADTNVAAGSCTIHYRATTGLVRLQDNAGSWGAWTTFGGGTIANSQCSLDLAQSSAVASGTNLTLTLRVTFTTTFVGMKTTFMRAASASGATTGWVARGTWHVGAILGIIGVTPNSGTGMARTFSLAVSDSVGFADLSSVRLRFGAANTGSFTCTIDYNAATAMVRIQNDAGGWGAWTPLGGGALANSQCSLDLALSSAVPAGTLLTLNWRVTFATSFIGTKTVYARAASATSTIAGWTAVGTWTVYPEVSAVSITPGSGAGVAQTFALVYSDTAGATDLRQAQLRFGPGNVEACMIHYNATTGLLRLMDDTGAWGPWTALGPGTLANSQCSIDLSQSSASPSGTTLTLTLDLTFDATFAGTWDVYMRATSVLGPSTGWVVRGSWTVSGPGPGGP